jgi:hypothetical protein
LLNANYEVGALLVESEEVSVREGDECVEQEKMDLVVRCVIGADVDAQMWMLAW